MANDNLVNILEQALSAFGPSGENWAQGKEAYSRPKCCVTLSFTADHPNALEDSEIDEGCVALAEVLGISPDDLEPWNDDPLRKWPDVKELFEKAIARAREWYSSNHSGAYRLMSVTGQLEDLLTVVADFAQQIREEDCKAVCELCNGPDNLDGAVRDKTGKWVHVLIRGTQICAAAAIRNLAEKEKV